MVLLTDLFTTLQQCVSVMWDQKRGSVHPQSFTVTTSCSTVCQEENNKFPIKIPALFSSFDITSSEETVDAYRCHNDLSLLNR